MPWKESCVMDWKVRLIADWLSGDYSVSALSRGYGVSRGTIYKWIRRYENQGAEGLIDQSRAPKNTPHAVPDDIAQKIIEVKRAHPSFGPKKVVDLLKRHKPNQQWPADSTAGEILKRAGLVKPRRYKKPYPADPQPFELGTENNRLWSGDYKGQYTMSDGKWCYPLTITDNASRYLIGCTAVTGTSHDLAKPAFEWAFSEYGLPDGLLTDNGPPFASRSAGGLTRLSLWWVQLGIRVHRSKPGTPTQNARHERMHGSMNRAIGQQMRKASLVRQQRLLQEFRHEYNEDRSHESLDRKPPSSMYRPSQREYSRIIQPAEYTDDQEIRRVRQNGEIKLNGQLIYVSQVLAGQPIGLRQVDNDRVELKYRFHLLGHIDLTQHRLVHATTWHVPKAPNV